ncbi:unnamed protein product [Symbiodinium natans]|uniref:Uncharacterized protein n=1 Tax=Symbiodinium natans TaxID=878477 RepID=A0A812M470_9DINO|nr:unnamed protein product [Symbiodinium natans]
MVPGADLGASTGVQGSDQMSNIRGEESSKYQEEVELNTQSAKTVEGAVSKLSGGTSFLQRRAEEPDKGYVLGLLKGIQVADTCIADIGDTQRSTSATGGAGCDGSGRLAAADGRAARLTKTRTELDESEKAVPIGPAFGYSIKDQETVLQNEVLQKSRLLAQSKLDLVEAQRVHDEEKEGMIQLVWLLYVMGPVFFWVSFRQVVLRSHAYLSCYFVEMRRFIGQESSADMMQMVADTKEDCAAKAAEFDVRKEDQDKERAALVEATGVLKEEEGGAKAANFLQVDSESHRAGEEKEVELVQHQTRDKAEGMGQAAEVRDLLLLWCLKLLWQLVFYVPLKWAVLGLVDAIESHQTEDAKRKSFCEVQMGNNQNSKAKTEGDLVRLKAREAFLESEVGATSKEVTELKAQAQAFTERLTKLEAARTKEKASYKASTKDRELTVQVVKKAKGIVESFYATKDPQGLVQVRDHQGHEPTEVAHAADEPKKEQKAPPETWTLGSSRKGGLGQSVIAMLDTIMWDFKKEQEDAEKAEQKADDSLDKIREDTKKLFDKKLEHVSRLLQEKARDAEELTQVKADSELKNTALTATTGALSKLDKECKDLLANFGKVAKERKRQILQLKDVADILSGATVGSRTGVKAGLLALESLQA